MRAEPSHSDASRQMEFARELALPHTGEGHGNVGDALGASATAADLTAESAAWLAALASCGAENPRPLQWELVSDAVSAERLFPLWLEPEIDYRTGRIVTARDPQGHLPSRPVRAHETAHWALAPLGATTDRCLGLEGLCDGIAAVLTGDPIMAVPSVPGLTRDLRHPAFDATADLSSRAHLKRVLQALQHVPALPGSALDHLAQLLDQVSDDDIQPHAFGVPFGHWLWTVLSRLSHESALNCLVHAAAVAQPDPDAAVGTVVAALPLPERLPARDLAAKLGLVSRMQ